MKININLQMYRWNKCEYDFPQSHKEAQRKDLGELCGFVGNRAGTGAPEPFALKQ